MTALARREEVAPAANGNGALLDLDVDLDEAARAVEQLVADADEEALHYFRNQTEARRLYQDMAGNRAAANHFARGKLLIEAGLGALSLMEAPKLDRSRRPHGSDRPLPKMIYWWRAMAMAQERGALVPLFDEVASRGDTIATSAVGDLVVRYGWTQVPAKSVRAMVDSYCAASGDSLNRISRRAGFGPSYLSATRNFMTWVGAKAVMEAIGEDPRSLPPGPSSYRKREAMARWLKRERRRTGGRWDKAYGYFRQCVDQFKDLAPNNDPYWQEAYRHLKEIEDIIGFQMDKERAQKRTKQ